MVEPIGSKPSIVAADRVVAPVAAPRAAPAIAARAEENAGASALRTLSSAPPVDAERVARIRKAIADGRFPLYPTTVADRLLALKLEWSPNDAA